MDRGQAGRVREAEENSGKWIEVRQGEYEKENSEKWIEVKQGEYEKGNSGKWIEVKQGEYRPVVRGGGTGGS